MSLKRYRLKQALAELYATTARRIHLPKGMDERQFYDFAVVLPVPETREQIHERCKQGINEYFAMETGYEKHLVDAYVITAPENKLPKMTPRDDRHGLFSTSSVEYCVTPSRHADQLAGLEPWDHPDGVGIVMVTGVSARGTAEEFCRTLEMTVDRPVVNETRLQGEFEFYVPSPSSIIEDFRDSVCRHLGLMIEVTQRELEILVLRPVKEPTATVPAG